MSLEGEKNRGLAPLIITKIDEVEIQDIMSLEKRRENLKKIRAFLMKDYSILSKAFSRSILRIIWPR